MFGAACASQHFSNGYLLKSQENYQAAVEEFEKVPPDSDLGPLAAKEIQDLQSRLKGVGSIDADGEKALSQGRYARARRLFEHALRMQPGDERAQQGLAAIEAYETGKVTEGGAVVELKALLRAGRFSEVRRKARAYLKRFPKSKAVQAEAQHVLQAADQREAELTQELERADELSDERPLEAVLILRELHRKFPGNPRPRERLDDLQDGLDSLLGDRVEQAAHLADAKDLQGALETLEENLRVDPKHAASLSLYRKLISAAASRSYQEGDFATAAGLWERQLKYDPQDGSARRSLEKARRLMKSLKKM